MGDFNIAVKNKSLAYDEFCDLFKITNLIKLETCSTYHHKSLIDLFLINSLLYFQKTHVGETGLTDCHKAIITCFKIYYFLLRLKVKLPKLQEF